MSAWRPEEMSRAIRQWLRGSLRLIHLQVLAILEVDGRDADTILVMDHGSIVEQGDHAALLAAGGFYADLYESLSSAALTEVA